MVLPRSEYRPLVNFKTGRCMKRRRMSRGGSKRNFRHNAKKVHVKNINRMVPRGGIRL